jgi:membrane protease YdiL (CAAX protease family)
MQPNAFLAQAGSRERVWWRAPLVLVVGGLLALIAIGATMMAVLGISALVLAKASHGALSFAAAYQQLTDFGRTGRSLQSYSYELASVGLGSFAAALAFIALAARVYGRPIRSFLTSAPRFRWGLVVLGLAVSAPILGASLIVEAWGNHPATGPLFTPGAEWWGRAVYLAAAVGGLYLAALAEEMLFRGWLLQQSAVLVRNTGLLLLINGLLFSAAHFDPSPGAFLIRAAMGAGWTWVVLRTGGVEFALGAHLANNLAVSLFVRPVTFVAAARQPINYRELGIEVAGILLVIAAVEGLVRFRSGRLGPAADKGQGIVAS